MPLTGPSQCQLCPVQQTSGDGNMAPSAQVPDIFDDANRSPSKSSVLRSIIPSKVHRRGPSAGEALVSRPSENNPFGATPLLPADHPDAALYQHPLCERAHNRDAAGGARTQQRPSDQSGKKGLHNKTKSSVSLKSLMRDGSKESKPSEPSENDSKNRSPKKTKSSASLSIILKRSQRGRKGGELAKDSRDKENQTPSEPSEIPSPTWAQLAAHSLQGQSGKVYRPEKGRTLDDQVSLYTPSCYSPSKQRNFFDYQQPSLPKPRPKSDIISASSWKVREMLSMQRTPSNSEYQEGLQKEPSRGSEEGRRTSVSSSHSRFERKHGSTPKRGSRVLAAVSAFNAKEAETQKRLDPKDIEIEFEKLLDARNIPLNMREKMRSLDTNIKADFIQKDRTDSGLSLNSTSSNTTNSDGSGRHRRMRDNPEKEDKPSHGSKGSRSRSRSRTFTFSKGDSSKKQKSEIGTFYKRPKSVDLSLRPGSSKGMTPSTSMTSLSATLRHDTAADPSDFIHYLREVQKPEIVEVGKLHKLRLLLRNETVSWVDNFILDGGMDEVVQLLYRIMKVEWREEHEDALLHETLLCLKALCTTSLALTQLTAIESELFPALLKMLFDEEKKGPSEYTTRGIIISLLFTYLSTAPTYEISARASTILSYLRDPSPPEENQPLDFIANIYQSRPYRVWCKEVTNVTKEVFWIFLHHLNVVPIVQPSDSTESSSESTFLKRHFPPPRPPVPAAPYVGGVEWDATNYVAAHLELMNGLIASLPTKEERNAVRTDLRASGFEKVMGGSLRTCKEKFHSAVHDCLKIWVAAALEDGWDYKFVREGPPKPGAPGSPTKSPVKAVAASPKKGHDEEPPKLELPLDIDGDRNAQKQDNGHSWLDLNSA